MTLKTAKANDDDKPKRDIEPDPAWLAATLGYLNSYYENEELTDGVLGLATTVLRGIEAEELPIPSLRVSSSGRFNVRWFQSCGCQLGITFIDASRMRFSARYHDDGNGKPGREGPFYLDCNQVSDIRELVLDFHGNNGHRGKTLLRDAKNGGKKC